MKKKINLDAIQNELAGSVFFPSGSPTPPASSDEDDFKNYTPPSPLPSPTQPITHTPPVESPSPQTKPVSPVNKKTSVMPDGVKTSHKSAENLKNPYARTDVRRFITRTPFEFYQDQLEWLRNASMDDRASGGKGSMSRMVREALDEYIAKKSKK